MGRSVPRTPALKLYLVLNAAALFAAAVLMTGLARSGGYSTPRLLLVAAAALLGVMAAAAALLLHLRPSTEDRLVSVVTPPRRWLRIALAALFLLCWCLTWFPPQSTGSAYYYFIGLYPLVLCALLASGTALVWLAAVRGSSTARWLRYFRERKPALSLAVVALSCLAFVAWVAVRFRILQGYEPYWYGAGVPLLPAQVLLVAVLGVLALRWETWSGFRWISGDALVFIGIWAVAAALWASRPVPSSFWITAARPPNFESYPFSDPATYDVASQFALIGQGIFNHVFFDRALYMSFLVYLHVVGGQNYQNLMAIQAVLFAVFPAVLYLIGRQLHSRTAGVVLAALVTLRGLTSLDASAWIDTATFKHMLTDFPTAIGVAVFLLLILRWSGSPEARPSALLWAGGVLGLTSLLRPHVLFLLAATPFLAFWIHRPRWRTASSRAALVILAFLMAVLPWLTLGPGRGSLLTLYGDRIRAVIAQRYPAPGHSGAPAVSENTAVVQAGDSRTVVPESPAPTAASTAAADAVGSPPLDSSPAPAVSKFAPPEDPGPPFVVDHFVHNIITAVLIFPNTPQWLGVRSLVKEGEGFWRPRWSGDMSPWALGLLVLNLVLVCFGIGLALQRRGSRALLPIAVLLLYLLADSFARTSGGRYIVPVDWILIGYFSIAVAELAHAASTFPLSSAAFGEARSTGPARRVTAPAWRRSSANPRRFWSQPVTVLGLILFAGALIPLAGLPFPRRYSANEADVLMAQLRQSAPDAGSETAIRTFLEHPDAVLIEGRLLYPLHYRQGEGEPTRYAPYTALDFPRTVFVLIGPEGLLHVILPGGRPPPLPNGSDAILLGCRVRGLTFDLTQAVALVLPDEGLGLVRSPSAPLACPLPEPVCDGNGNCR